MWIFFILVYIISIIGVHLIYREIWIKDRIKKEYMRSPNHYYIGTTLSDFYDWFNGETKLVSIVFYIPVVNTCLILYQCIVSIYRIIGKYKFI